MTYRETESVFLSERRWRASRLVSGSTACLLSLSPQMLSSLTRNHAHLAAIFSAEGLINNSREADTLATYRSRNNNEEEGLVGSLMKCLFQMGGPGGLGS